MLGFAMFAVLIAVPIAVHVAAEAGSDVTLYFGLVKYRKPASTYTIGKPPVPASAPILSAPEIRTLDAGQLVPILDGALNLRVEQVNGAWKLAHVKLGGANVKAIRVGARSPDGSSIPLQRERSPEAFSLFIQEKAYLEFEYKGHTYELLFEIPLDPPFKTTLRPVNPSILKLELLTDLT